jgi:hypothetical protein
MKSYKLFSVLALLVAVLFMGTIQPVDASIDTDEPTIVDIVSVDEPADIIQHNTTHQEISLLEAGPQFTAMEVCSFHESYAGDQDHQVISLYIHENSDYGYLGDHLYRARSDLSNSMYA